jgi:DNA-binding MltR family transcriptional regulator
MDSEKRGELIFKAICKVMDLEKLKKLPVKEVIEFRCSLSEESDRGCALMAAAYLEYELEKLIESILIEDKNISKKLFSGTGCLATFSSKIDLAYMLGLISSDIRSDLHILRKIRNEFAHDPEKFGFERDKIRNRCNELKMVGFPNEKNSRFKFTSAMMGSAAAIHGAILKSKRVKPKLNVCLEEQREYCEIILDTIIETSENS